MLHAFEYSLHFRYVLTLLFSVWTAEQLEISWRIYNINTACIDVIYSKNCSKSIIFS